MFFRLLAGQHIQANKSKPILDADDKPTGRYEQQVFLAPAKVESSSDLVAKFGADKFRLIDKKGRHVEVDDEETPTDNEPSTVSDATRGTRNLAASYGELEKLSMKELKEIAHGEEIDITSATNKAEILAILRNA